MLSDTEFTKTFMFWSVLICVVFVIIVIIFTPPLPERSTGTLLVAQQEPSLCEVPVSPKPAEGNCYTDKDNVTWCKQ